MEKTISNILHLGPSATNGNDRYQGDKPGIMLIEAQAIAVAEFLVGHTPGADGELEHSHITAWQLACEALAALGHVTETSRGARLLPSPRLPARLPRWDDTCCVVLKVAVQAGSLKLRHRHSMPGDATGLATAAPETIRLLDLLGLTKNGSWSDAATLVLWRVAPDEVRPPDDAAFLEQVDQTVATMPEHIEARIREICAEHKRPMMRHYLVDWIFFEHWRWGEGWLVDERQGRVIGVFHDHLAQRMRAAVLSRLPGI
jgi:pellino protein